MKIKNKFNQKTILTVLLSSLSLIFMSKVYGQEFSGVGFTQKNGYAYNIFDFIEHIHTGECADRFINKEIGWFKHKDIKPQKGRRVRIYNKTSAEFSKEIPYTDRKYSDNETGSEHINIRIGSTHENRYFKLQEGLNKLAYIIYEGKNFKKSKQIIEEGTFNVNVGIETREEEVNIENWKPDFYCYNPITNREKFLDDIIGNGDCATYKHEGFVLMARLKGRCSNNRELRYKNETRVNNVN